jgi:hypothetical protein
LLRTDAREEADRAKCPPTRVGGWGFYVEHSDQVSRSICLATTPQVRIAPFGMR